jgi:transposase-like protein
MVHYQIIHCLHCEGTDLQKNGKSPEGTQRWYCKECEKYFRIEYRYNACKKEVKEKIIEMTLNSSGVRDIGRVLGISKDTVTSELKKNSIKNEPLFSDKRRKRQVGKIGSGW